ncbi:hypothetical protein [Oryzifoliimicrobium ureilyticus]|uniref:hypothetical protein n=1 Tax=Oryzifoliimicrobium ureilyticus TaxID=3113724 RepID=UPI003075F45B
MRKTLAIIALATIVSAGAAVGVMERSSDPVTTQKTHRITTNTFLNERFAG